jgi:hypothetical protein
VRVGVGDEPVAIEERDTPVHGGIGRQAGLDGEDVVREIAIALGDRIEARARTEHGEPGCPDVGRHQIGVGTRFQHDLQQVARVEAEDWPSVGGDVADARQSRGEAIGGREVRHVDEVVDLTRQLALLVDGRDLHREHEARLPVATGRQPLVDGSRDVVAQAEQAGLGRHQRLLQLSEPDRMGEVAGADDRDALLARPIGEVFEVAVLARGTRVFRMDVEIGVKAHRQASGGVRSDLRSANRSPFRKHSMFGRRQPKCRAVSRPWSESP